jgi:hypothetical protein
MLVDVVTKGTVYCFGYRRISLQQHNIQYVRLYESQ